MSEINPQELTALSQLIQQAAKRQTFGSFSERNPLLGKMKRCPFCKQRRRQNSPPCCNPTYIVTSESLPKEKKRKNPRLTRNRPPLFLMRQILLDIEGNYDKIKEIQNFVEGLPGCWTPYQITPAHHLATLVERYVIKKRKIAAKKKRNRQKESRKINRKK